jgi:DNA-binding NtrC family response regulator
MPGKHKRKLLLVDDDAEFLADAAARLSSAFECVTTPDFDAAVGLCERTDPDAVLLDLLYGPAREPRGFEVLTKLRDTHPFVPIIMWTEEVGLPAQLEARRRGAFLYVMKPAGADEIAIVLDAALEERGLALQRRAALDEVDKGWGEFLYASDVMRRLLAEVDRIATTDQPVLITGERGVGKGLLAREIHRRSRRCNGPFTPVDCPALNPNLFGSELFGHEKGAFTGATTRKLGMCDEAEGGTLFLDEVGDMPKDTQVQLRRLVDERVFRRVQGDRWRSLDVRIIAATNKNLDALAKEERFESDLLDRLAANRVNIPPLRERPADIPVLARRFAAAYGREIGKPVEIAEETLLVLSQRKWEGNARELRHAIERACALADGPVLTAADMFTPSRRSDELPVKYHDARKQNELEFKRRFATAALERSGGNVEGAADEAGIPRQTMYRIMREVGVAKAR